MKIKFQKIWFSKILQLKSWNSKDSIKLILNDGISKKLNPKTIQEFKKLNFKKLTCKKVKINFQKIEFRENNGQKNWFETN